MEEISISIGDIIIDINSKIRYRVISILDTEIILCEMDITKLKLYQNNLIMILNLLDYGELYIENEDSFVFDENKLSEGIRENYIKKRAIMREVVKYYGPSYLGLLGKSHKPELDSILEKYSYSKQSFWRNCVKYFQSGMKDYSLVDSKAFGINKEKKYNYIKKAGRKPKYFLATGVVKTKDIENIFEEMLKEYKSGRHKSVRSVFDKMNNKYFKRIEVKNGVVTQSLMKQSERPTLRQLYYYFQKNLSEQERDLIKTSSTEQRNDKRLIVSDSLNGVYGPGDMVEIDACEVDISLVSSLDNNKTIGRPIVYFMIDVYTRLILAVSVAFDNNSILGVTNLFINLSDDKKKYCAKYGIEYDNDKIWPSNIIPRRLRVDRGSEFKSKEFDRICNELGIEKQLVSGGLGSLKGTVEQSFHKMHSKQNVHLENFGLIEKRYDSEHHIEATLNINQYTKMIINFVLTHNQQYNEDYPLTKEMIENKVKPIPSLLWEFGIKKYGNPRPIPIIEQYLYTLMTPVNAKVSRKGISYKDLYYFSLEDKVLHKEMFNAGNKKVPFKARMDKRDVSQIYYIRDNQLIVAPLNEALAGNADYKGYTMKEYEDFRKYRKKLNAEGRIHNEELSALNYEINEGVVDDAKKTFYSDKKDMRINREIEKQLVSSEGKISTSLNNKNCIEEESKNSSKVKENSKSKNISYTDSVLDSSKYKDYSSFEDALDDYYTNDN